jgi:hypothetical protein
MRKYSKYSKYMLAPLVPVMALIGAAPTQADSAKPEDPNGYGEVVNFGAREDHDVYPGPGNVIGGVRSDIATSGPGELGSFVQQRRQDFGSTPNPPGKN